MEDVLSEPGKMRYLPRPVGAKILIAIPKLARKTAKGVELPEELIQREEMACTIAKVVAMGADAYKTLDCAEPYCKVGDWVVMRPYSGTRIRIEGWDSEFRLVNDNTIEGVVEDPEFIMRAGSVVTMRKIGAVA
jgi:co-chaperonin GroES (HSP10)